MMPDTEDRFRDLLAAVDPPPARITVADLVETGQRTRRRRRQWLATGVAGVATLGVGAAVGAVSLVGGAAGPGPATATTTDVAAPAAACVAERLAVPAGFTAGGVNTGSPSGRYLAGYATGANSAGTPVRWDGTRAEKIAVPGIGEAQGVNDQGVVVGEGQAADQRSFAWAYVDGKVVELPLPDGYTSAEATGVNAAGRVSGVLFDGDRAAAAIWHGTTATARVEVLDAPAEAMAFGIADDGAVVGGPRDGEGAYRWDANGQVVSVSGREGVRVGSILGVRGGWAYGLAHHPTGQVPPTAGPDPTRGTDPGGPVTSSGGAVSALWNLTAGHGATSVTIEPRGTIKAVNARGAAVLNGEHGGASIRNPDGTLRALPDLAASAKSYAYALSDDGTAAAGTAGDQPIHWTC